MSTSKYTKQFLVNYDSTILYPYTTLDCILGDANSTSATGADAIISKLLDANSNLYVYDSEGTNTSDLAVHPTDVNGNMFVLGLYTPQATSKNAFIKLQSILPNDADKENYYLSQNGNAYRIGTDGSQQVEFSDYNTGVGTGWLTGSVTTTRSTCAIKLSYNLDPRYFEVSNTGALEIKNAKEVEYTVRIKDLDKSTGGSVEGLDIDQHYHLQIKDGLLQKSNLSSLGSSSKPAYIKDGQWTDTIENTIGSTNKPVYLSESGFKSLSMEGLSGINDILIMYDPTDGFIKSNLSIDNGKPITVTDGEFTEVEHINYDLINVPSSMEDTRTYVLSAIKNENHPSWKVLTSSRIAGPGWDAEGSFSQASVSAGEIYVMSCQIDTTSPKDSVPGWIKKSEEVGVEATGESSEDGDIFYLAGVRMKYGVDIKVDDDNTENYVETKDSDFTGVYDATFGTMYAKKLGFSANTWKNPTKGIYFKGLKLYQTSDERLKTFTQDLDIDLDKIKTIKKGIFYWKDDEHKLLDIGVSAQSVEKLFPELVDNLNDKLSVSYDKLGVIALAAIDKLHEENLALKKEIAELKKKIEK